MPAIRDLEKLPVSGREGNYLGTVQSVLFDPSEPRAVALQVIPPNLAVVIERKPRFLPLRPGMLASAADEGVVAWDGKKLPTKAAVAKEIGASVDDTVIWRDMEVRLSTGERAGYVHDVGVSRKTGKVLRLVLSEGSVADFAVGKREVPGELVGGFDGTAVVVDASFRALAQSSGGLAAATGKGAAYARYGADKAADAALSAGVAGLGMLERSFRSGLGRKAVRGLRRAGKHVRKTIDGGT